MNFTTNQLLELARHKIPLFNVFDATGMTLAEAKAAMSANKEEVMVNGLPCQNDPTHTLRSRYGKCVGCNPATLAMQRRKSRPGAVYLAESPALGLVKVGMSVDHKVRLERLRFYAYGGANDWRFVAVAQSKQAGKLEHELHASLANCKEALTYEKDGRLQQCNELFRCDTAFAYRVFRDCITKDAAVTVLAPGML